MIDEFAGAIFRGKSDPSVIYVSDAPIARNHGGSVELMLFGPAANGPRKYRKSDWFDTTIKEFVVILAPARVFVGGRLSSITADRSADDGSGIDKLIIKTGSTPAYALPIAEALAITSRADGHGRFTPVAFTSWVPPTAPGIRW